MFKLLRGCCFFAWFACVRFRECNCECAGPVACALEVLACGLCQQSCGQPDMLSCTTECAVQRQTTINVTNLYKHSHICFALPCLLSASWQQITSQ
jgi:hypothetical protein